MEYSNMLILLIMILKRNNIWIVNDWPGPWLTPREKINFLFSWASSSTNALISAQFANLSLYPISSSALTDKAKIRSLSHNAATVYIKNNHKFCSMQLKLYLIPSLVPEASWSWTSSFMFVRARGRVERHPVDQNFKNETRPWLRNNI
jgi:hypothetical protein